MRPQRPLVPALTGDGRAPATRPLGVGVLGCAEIALRRFLPALGASVGARLVAVASRDPGRAEAAAARLGCAATDYRGLVESDDVDLVYVPLPNHLHEAWAVAALERGRHVLCEKPLGLSPASVDRMIAAAERSGRLLFENLQYLQHPQHARVAALLATLGLGRVTGLACRFHIPDPTPGNFRLDPASGGGAFHDLARYPLSAAALHLRGEPGPLLECELRRRGGLDRALRVVATTTAGEQLAFSVAFGRPYESWYELQGTRGTVRLDRAFTPPPDHGCRLVVTRGGTVETVAMPAADQFRLTIEHVAGLIAAGGPFEPEHGRARRLALATERLRAAAVVTEEGP